MMALIKLGLFLYLFFLVLHLIYTYIVYVIAFSLFIYMVSYFAFKKIKFYANSVNYQTLLSELNNLKDNPKLQKEKVTKEINTLFKFNMVGRILLRIYIQASIKNINNGSQYQYNKNNVKPNSIQIKKYLNIFEINSEEDLLLLGKIKFNKKYKELSKRYHPDKPTGDKDKMVLLNEAREKLLLLIK